MGGHGKPRWKISSLYHRSPSSTPARSPPPPPSAQPPAEFVCPISGRLMADPVILPTGQTFERGCAQACKDLGVAPPGAAEAAGGAADLFLIPNNALRTAIYNWCDSVGVDRPKPVDPATAVQLVGLLRAATSPSAPNSPPSSSGLSGAAAEVADAATMDTEKSTSLAHSSPQVCPSSSSRSSPSTMCYFTTTTTATSTFNSSSSSSSEILSYDSHSSIKPVSATGSPTLEEEILAGLKDTQVSEQEAALQLLRSSTRDGGGDNRTALCTPKILAALRPMLLSRYPSLQSHAAASLVNLSLHPSNRVRVVRAGTVPALVDALKGGHAEAQYHAVSALFSLSIDDENRAAIGVLGALPPLLHLLSRSQAQEPARRDAAMALYYLSMSGTNRTKLVKLGAIKTLLGLLAAAPRDAPTLLCPVLMILCNLAACGEGRAAMMDAGAVEAIVRLLKGAGTPSGKASAAATTREYCVQALYGMSKGGMRFRGLARAAGAEEALRTMVEEQEAVAAAATIEEGEENAPGKEKRWRLREMARRTLRAAGGGDEDDDSYSFYSSSEDGSAGGDASFYGIASEPALRARQTTVNAPCPNSTRF